MDNKQFGQGLDFINWLKDPDYQFELHFLDEEEVDKKIQENTDAKQLVKEEHRVNAHVIKRGKEEGSRAHTTSIRYKVLNRSILSPLSTSEVKEIYKKIRQQVNVCEKSFYFYFFLLLNVYPKERQTIEEYSKFYDQVKQGVEVYFKENPNREEFVEMARKEIMRIAKATEYFFRGDIETTINLCYDDRERNSNNVGSLKTTKRKLFEKIQMYDW